MSGRALLVYGSGGHGKVVADAAQSAGWRVIGFVDDSPAKAGATVLGLPVCAIGFDAAVTRCREHDASVVVALGDNRVRQRVFDSLCKAGIDVATVVHRAAVIAPSVAIGAGTVIFAGAVVNPCSQIGRNAIINTGATIDHDNVIGNHAHVAPGAHTGGTVVIGEGAMIGVGAALRNNVTVGEWSIVGVGAAVVSSIPAHVVAYGTPARVRKHLP